MSLSDIQRPTSWQRTLRRPHMDRPDIITPGCMAGRWWSESDTRTLENLAGKVPAEEIAAMLGRTRYAVRVKARECSLSVRMPLKPKRHVREVDHARAKETFARCFPSMRAIIRQVSEETGISIGEMLCYQRSRPIVRARWLMIWTMARDLKFSVSQMARLLGRDHTSLRNAIIAIDRERGTSVMSLRNVANGGRPQ